MNILWPILGALIGAAVGFGLHKAQVAAGGG